MLTPDTVLVICRNVIYMALLFLWGGALFRQRLSPGASRKIHEPILLIAFATAVAVLLPVQVARAAQDWSQAFDSDLVAAVISRTTPGRSWTVQAVGALLLIAAYFRRSDLGIVCAGVIIMAGLSLTGHAAASDGVVGLLRQANNVLHLAASAAWIGALPYVMALLPRLSEPSARDVLIRYSGEGHFWVALVLSTGIAATFWIFGGLPTSPSVPYQALWWIKTTSVAAMVLLALHNRYVSVPRLRNQPTALASIRSNTIAEIGLGSAAIALVALFGTLQPR